MRKLTALLAGLIFTVHLTSCTSKDSKDESMGDEAVAESTAGTDGDLDKLDAAPADAAQAANSEGFLDEQLPEDALGESTKTAKNDAPPAEAPPADANAGGDLNLGDNTTPPPAAAPEEPKMDAVADAGAPPPPMDSTPPPADATASVDTGATSSFGASDTSSAGTVASTQSDAPAPKPKASLKKVESTPFTRNGVLLNAVYVARPKDNYKKIAKMIFGDGKKSKDLSKANPGVKSPHVGDKIYYNSPARPTDDTKILTFFEDSGMAPEVYVAQEGDDLKKVSKKLLGYDNAWKELWATNSVESKGALPAGTEIRYWKSAPAAAPAAPPADVAMNTPPPAEPQQAQPMPDMPPPPPPTEMAPPPPPQPQQMAQNDVPPPPQPQQMAPPPPPPPPAQELPPPPPPPPPEAVNPPPPPPMPKKTLGKDTAGADGGLDNDMIMTLAGVGIIIFGLAAVIMIRRKRQNRDMANAFNDTQVGT